MKKILFTLTLLLLTTPIFSKAKIQVEELDYLGPPAESWLVAGMRSTVTNDLRRVAGNHNFEVVTVEDQNEALKIAGEKRKAGAKIDLSEEAAKILAVDYRCVGSVQNLDKVVRVTLRLLKAPDYKVWKSTTTDKNRSELLDLQNVVVYNLLNDIDGKLTNEDKKIIEIARPKSLTAYELYAQGIQFEKKPNLKQALLFMEQAIELDEDYFEAYRAAGVYAQSTHQHSKAVAYLLKAEKILRNRGENNTKTYGLVARDLAFSYTQEGDLKKALEYYLKSKTIYDNLGLQDTVDYAYLMHSMGDMYVKKGDFDKGMECFLKSKTIYDNAGYQNKLVYAQLMFDIGNAYSDKGDEDKALEYYLKSKTKYDNLGLQNTSDYAQLMLVIGNAYSDKGDLEKALEFYLKSKTIYDNLGKQNIKNYAILMSNMGGVYNSKGDSDKSLEVRLKSKTIYDNLGLQNTSYYAGLLDKIGIVYSSKGDLDKALEFYLKSKTIRDSLGLQNTSSYAILMQNLGVVYEKINSKTEASKSWRKAYEIYSKLGFEKKASEVLKWAEDIEK